MVSASGPGQAVFSPAATWATKPSSLGQRLEVLVVVAAPEKDHVTRAQGPVAPLPVLDVLLADQGTVPDGGVVQQVAHVDNAGPPPGIARSATRSGVILPISLGTGP